ncbi:MAG: tetratricopeptide repeat protein [Bacteroidales bacterium]|nr:tetratricopeptide repeat protein [Bacteroidales bacterium]
MKKLIILILIAAFNLQGAFASDTVDSLFTAANTMYSNNSFDEAIAGYEHIINLGFESAEIYYNLGNAYYKIRNYPKAILNYERALLLDPSNEDITYNLNKVKMYNIDEIDQIPEFVIRRWVNSLISLVNTNLWSIISLSAFVLMLVLLLVYFITVKIDLRKSAFYISVILLIISVSTFYCSYKSKMLLAKENSCIAISSTITVKSSPSQSSTNLFIIHEGTKVYIVDELDEWYEIKLSDGKQGWLLKEDVEPI